MKKLLLLLMLTFVSLFGETKWGDLFDGYDEAKSQNKRVMIMLSMKGCPGCEYMKGVVFEDKAVAASLEKNFIAIELDVHSDFVPEELEYFATPTFYFLDADENILKRLNGGENAQKFIKTLEAMKK
ncbi:MAG: thioredoxin fold domain-containing protein [Campylobacterota bacterium]|nr:thioredoxin fold domain-containing protein [Campylobacterota bacterium]